MSDEYDRQHGFLEDDEEDEPPAADFGFYFGVVVDREDPDRLGRVRAYIPGKFDPSTPWALPCGMPGSGSRAEGDFNVPPLGATVLVGFAGGDVDLPIYFSGPWGNPEDGTESEIPYDAATRNPDETPRIRVIETQSFRIVIDEAPGTPLHTPSGAPASGDNAYLLIAQKRRSADDPENAIEINARDNSITLKSETSLNIKCNGIVSVEGTVVQIHGRRVQKFGGPI